MAIQAQGTWVIIKSVTDMTSNDVKKAPMSSGIVVSAGSGTTGVSQGDMVYFSNSNSLSVYHTNQNIYVIQAEDLVAIDV